MSLARQASFIGKMLLLWVVVAVVLLCLSLGALGFLAVAFLIWLSHLIGGAGAVAVTGLLLVLEAVLLGLSARVVMRRMKAKRPQPTASGINVLGLVVRLASVLVRRSPRGGILASLIAGAVAEYFSARKKSDPKG